MWLRVRKRMVKPVTSEPLVPLTVSISSMKTSGSMGRHVATGNYQYSSRNEGRHEHNDGA